MKRSVVRIPNVSADMTRRVGQQKLWATTAACGASFALLATWLHNVGNL